MIKFKYYFILLLLMNCTVVPQKKQAAKAETLKKIAYVSSQDDNYEIYTLELADHSVKRLTNHEAMDFGPKWSPDGKKIAFFSDQKGNFDIYLMEEEGEQPQQLTNHEADDFDPLWSFDGQQIIFARDVAGQREVMIIDANGKNERQLTDHPADDWSGHLSSDGQWFVFISNRDATLLPEDPMIKKFTGEIYKMRIDGTGLKRLTFNENRESLPSISPDGKTVLFTLHPLDPNSSNDEIYSIDIDTGEQTNLSKHPLSDEHASFVQNGEKILFDSNRDGGKLQLYLMNSDGSNPQRISRDTSHMEFWSSGF